MYLMRNQGKLSIYHAVLRDIYDAAKTQHK